MAIKISVQLAEGANVNAGPSSYLAGLPEMFNSSSNLGFFNGTLSKALQYGVAEKDNDGNGVFSDGPAMVAGGSLTYDMTTHVVDGKLNTLAFGTGLNGAPQTGGYGSDGPLSVQQPTVTFTGLRLNSAQGDEVGDILYGVMTGDEAAFVKFLAKTAVKFNGGDGNDTFRGGSKNDTLYGAGRADTLTGGGGKDTFIFKSVADSAFDAFDTITDYNAKQGDRINLKAIDADSSKTGNQAFTLIGGFDFSGKPGELRFEKNGKDYEVSGDVDGDGQADFTISLAKSTGLTEASFVL